MNNSRALAVCFEQHHRLTVRQRKKWLEIILNWESKNAYDVYDEDQRAVLHAEEVGGGLGNILKRMFLGPLRPFEVAVSDSNSGALMLQLHRRFRFIFHRLDVLDGEGNKVGAIERQWSWFRRIYNIEDASGRVVATVFGPFLKPWTFEIKEGERVVGMIQKKWSGLGREMFTDADNFGVDLGTISDPTLRALAFSATVLIDVMHFERAKQ